MSYSKQTWTDNVSVANASTLGHIEDGIEAAGAQRGTRTITVAANDESAAVKANADYVCDGVADEVQINAALSAVGGSGTTIGYGTSGGTVVLVGRQFTIANSIILRNQVELVGAYGGQGTFIKPAASGWAPGAANGLIELESTNTQYVNVHNLTLTAAGSAYNGSGLYLAGGDTPTYDAHLKFSDLFIFQVDGDGIFLDGSRSNHLTNIRILEAGLHGINIDSPDTFLTGIDIGICGGDGFHISGANLHLANCKAWFNVGNGFNIISGSRDHGLSSCAAQDNNLHGFKIDGRRCTLAACVADSNGYPTGPGSGFFIGSTGFNVQGTASDKNEAARGLHQDYGVEFESSGDIGIVNVVTWQNQSGSVGGATPHANCIVNIIEQ